METSELLLPILLLLAGLPPLVYLYQSKRTTRSLLFIAIPWQVLIFALHYFVIVPHYVKENLDSYDYYRAAVGISETLTSSHPGQLPELSATAMPSYFAAPLFFLTPVSFVGLYVLASLVSLSASYLFIVAGALSLPRASRVLLIALFLFVPSFSMSKSLYGKDCFALLGIALVCAGAARLYSGDTRNRIKSSLFLLPGLFLLGCVRPITAVVVTGAVLAAYAFNSHSTLFTRTWIIGLTFLPVLMMGIVRFNEVYGVVYASEDAFLAALNKNATGNNTGGSATELERFETVSQYLQFLPKGMARFIFGPLKPDTGNAMVSVAAVENWILLALLVAAIIRAKTLVSMFRRDPFLIFCLVSLLGLAASSAHLSNYGLIMRLKAQALPFLFYIVLAGAGASTIAASAPHHARHTA